MLTSVYKSVPFLSLTPLSDLTLDGPPELAWNVVKRIGGNTGWYVDTSLWQIRGFVDKLLGGPGLFRGRRRIGSVAIGDSLDFCHVVAVDECCRLLLRAEMLAPGDAFWEFPVQVLPDDSTELRMIPSFEPHGIWGMVYWWIIPPPTPCSSGQCSSRWLKPPAPTS